MAEAHSGEDDTDPKYVVGFHGTTTERARQILNDGFRRDRRGGKWLGPGLAYFFQDAPNRARYWATNQVVPRVQQRSPHLEPQEPAVLRAELEITENWIDLLDLGPWQHILRTSFAELAALGNVPSQSEPIASSVPHERDHAVFQVMHMTLSRSNREIHAIRAPFIEGEPLFPESAIFEGGHVAVVVRDSTVIRRLERFDF